jgi:hypothetical protein
MIFNAEEPSISVAFERIAPFAAISRKARLAAGRFLVPTTSVNTVTLFPLAKRPIAVAFTDPSTVAPIKYSTSAFSSVRILSRRGSSNGSSHRLQKTT